MFGLIAPAVYHRHLDGNAGLACPIVRAGESILRCQALKRAVYRSCGDLYQGAVPVIGEAIQPESPFREVTGVVSETPCLSRIVDQRLHAVYERFRIR